MLLNLSNHPCSKWAENQRAAAIRQFGQVQDLAFPHVPPEADTDEVLRLAEMLYVEVRKHSPVAVHLMGELTLCYALIPMLQAAGIPCYAATSSRATEDLPDGRKLQHFTFVRFRAYPDLR
jgi:hypothetical protein